MINGLLSLEFYPHLTHCVVDEGFMSKLSLTSLREALEIDRLYISCGKQIQLLLNNKFFHDQTDKVLGQL